MLFLITILFFPSYYFPHKMLTILFSQCASTLSPPPLLSLAQIAHSSPGNYRSVVHALSASVLSSQSFNPYPIPVTKANSFTWKNNLSLHKLPIGGFPLPLEYSPKVIKRPPFTVRVQYLPADWSVPTPCSYSLLLYIFLQKLECVYAPISIALTPNLHIPHISLLNSYLPFKNQFYVKCSKKSSLILKNK